MRIQSIHARQILDSGGNPTIETEIQLEDGTRGISSVPSGVSTGTTEAVELRDKDENIFGGKGVLRAVENVNTEIAKKIIGFDASDQNNLDKQLIDLDGTENKSRLGANAILSVSIAACKAEALGEKKETFERIREISGAKNAVLPFPLILVLEGGKHGNWATDIQEYMITPRKDAFSSFAEIIRAGCEVFHALGKVLSEKKYATGVGLEGAYCPQELQSNEEGFEMIVQAVKKAGYKIPEQFVIAVDCASSEFYDNGDYVLKSEKGKRYKPSEWIEKIQSWTNKYPLYSIEDPFFEESWTDWSMLTQSIGSKNQIVGDDLLTTNPRRIRKGIDIKAVNSVLIKLNQIGTVSETLKAIQISKAAGFTTIVSHRSGETNDDFVADFAVGTASGQCKFGGPDRGERVAKYNRLLKIEQLLRRSR